MKLNDVTDYRVEGETAVITLSSPPVNALSAAVRGGIAAGLARAHDDARAQAIMLICDGRTFFAGADITEFGKPPVPPSLFDVQDMIEDAAKPVIMAIHGTALGGGLEIALVGHYRVAVPSARLGLPEVKLGLLPGAGGTQRLPRIVGVEKALEMIITGDSVDAAEAAAIGLIDAVVEEGGLRAGGLAFARHILAERRPLRKIRDRDERVKMFDGASDIFDAYRRSNAEKFPGFIAPDYNLQCIEAAMQMPFDAGIAFERERFRELRDGPQSAAQRHIFFAERLAARVPDMPAAIKAHAIDMVGVMGDGVTAAGLATMIEDAGLAVSRGPDRSAAARLSDCGLILDVQANAVATRHGSRITVIAATTKDVDLDMHIGEEKEAANILHLHFPMPGASSRVVEIIRSDATSLETVATAMHFVKRIAMVAVVVRRRSAMERMLAAGQAAVDGLIDQGVSPTRIADALHGFGFTASPFTLPVHAAGDATLALTGEALVARLLYPLINEAAAIIGDGDVSRASDLDILWVLGLGWPAYRGGPMFWADQIGVNHIVSTLDDEAARLGESPASGQYLQGMARNGTCFADLAAG